jgi:hypothetical protein
MVREACAADMQTYCANAGNDRRDGRLPEAAPDPPAAAEPGR